MDTAGRKIMYVGLQFSPSYDRPNSRPDRVWNGPGDVVENVPLLQADALCKHKEEWRDVTGLSNEDLQRESQAARAASEKRVRELRNPKDAPNVKRTVDSLSTEELEMEVERRKAEAAKIDQHATERAANKAGEDLSVKKTDANLVELGAKALDEILMRVAADNNLSKTLLNEEGLPTFEALQEQLGFQISQDEYRLALGLT